MTDNKFIEFPISKTDHGKRLDYFLKSLYPSVEYSLLQKSIRNKFVRLNGKKSIADAKLTHGDILRVPSFWIPKKEKEKPSSELPQEMIIHEDKDFLVLNKPHGLAVQGGSGTKEHIDKMLQSLPLRNGFRPSLTHRLDRDTSGCLLIAKKKQIATLMGHQFQSKQIDKYYLAMTTGKPPHEMGKVKAPLIKERDKDGLEKVRIADKTEDAKAAETLYFCLDYNEEQDISFLLLRPLTGRTHQLRVHLLSIGCPILGDPKYAPETMDILKRDKRLQNKLHLHSFRMSFTHPLTEEKMDFIAEPSLHFKKSIKYFNMIHSSKIGLDIYSVFDTMVERA